MKTVVFSGDIGVKGAPILRDPVVPIPPPADALVMESTYGDRDHRSLDATCAEFLGILKAAHDACAKVLIPAFAVGRTQDIIYHMGDFLRRGEIARLNVYVDSPMATETTDLYRRHKELYDEPANAILNASGSPLNFPGLRFVKTVEESKKLNTAEGCMVVIAASGMATGGRIVHHLRNNLYKPETQVVIVGYQGEGTLGRKLVDGAQRVRIYGEEVLVRAKVHTLGGFSAHAGQSGLVEWVKPLAASKPRVFLTHGENKPRLALRDKLASAHGLACSLPEYGEVVEL
jgi:metallo-beta-lactamase family protein